MVGIILTKVVEKFGYPKLDSYMAATTGKDWTGPVLRAVIGLLLSFVAYKYVGKEPYKSILFTFGTLTAVGGILDSIEKFTVAPAPAPSPAPAALAPPPTPAPTPPPTPAKKVELLV